MIPNPHSADDYSQLLMQLLPPGRAFDVQPGSQLAALLQGLAADPAAVDANRLQVIPESLPSETDDLLPDWELELGLPDDCAPSGQTVAERRQALVQKVTANQAITATYIEAAAAALGFTVTAVVQHMRQHGSLYGTCTYGTSYGSSGWNWVVYIEAGETTLQKRPYGSGYSESYANWGNELLQCVLSALIGPGYIYFIYST